MELTLGRDNVIDTKLSTADGHCLYTITTPNKWRVLTTMVTKHEVDGDGVEQSSTERGRINWHSFARSTRFIYDGKIMEAATFMPHDGLRVRRFVAPDGKSYRWRTGWRSVHLERCEDKGASESEPVIVVKMRQANPFKGRKPSLQVDDSVLQFLDLLVLTWVYVEHRRRGNGRHGYK
ncbi:hypothetical protein PsYK624_041790 [Phanerochaete sordida]|uniref:DUF6593 domain-containing protein n=1 Tax=Phanerochaete sordida TaxID=48140 RepID=A0A9P3G4I0_9APHY|nr:hypothetical protein PsYK624_041790 [Phanerochaete sordida]